MPPLRCALTTAAVVLFQILGLADEPFKIATITGASPASAEMVKLFRQKIAEHEKLFKLVNTTVNSVNVLFQADCLPRNSKTDPFICFYTLHYVGATAKSLMGGGVNVTKTADEMATGFLSSMAQDIVENMNNAKRTDAVQTLEACLFLTQSSCAVPGILAQELNTKTINLSQYLQTGPLDKTKPGAEAK